MKKLESDYNFLILVLFTLVIGLAATSYIVTLQIDYPEIGGRAFSLMHHFPELVAYTLAFLGLGLGTFWENTQVKIRGPIRVVGALSIVLYGMFASLQLAGVYSIGFPPFLFLFVCISYLSGVALGLHHELINTRSGL